MLGRMESWYPVGNLCNLEGRLGGPLEVQTFNLARCSIPFRLLGADHGETI